MEKTQIVKTQNNVNHVTDGPLTTGAIRQASPSLLTNEIDSRIVKIRPMSTPVDQISRMVGARPASSMVVEYYSVDTRPVSTKVKTAVTAADIDTDGDNPVFTVQTQSDQIFAVTDTLLFPSVLTPKQEPLVAYVSEKTDGGLKLIAVNVAVTETMPAISANKEIVRMGRAASELDVQTAQFEALPVKSSNYCQIFKAQVEQSTFAKLSSKEVGWSFNDQEEVAIMDMRLGMEKSFLFGSKARFTDPLKYDEVLFTGGIWNQAQGEASLTLDTLDEKALVTLMKQAFTGDAAGSTRTILVGGSDLIEALNKLDYTRMVSATDTVTRWGIDFSEIRSKFGSLYAVHSEVFDQCGHSADGMIIDPQYLAKYTHVPFRVEHLDLKTSGVRNTDALVATEASCLVLRHPKTHIRILGTWSD